jgi:hypothetical protein
VKPISNVVLRGHASSKGNRWDGEGGMGNGEGEGGSVYCQPGARVDGNLRHNTVAISK